MRTAARTSAEPRIRSVEVSEKAVTATLTDGRVISVPLSWSWRLERATPEQRADALTSPEREDERHLRGERHVQEPCLLLEAALKLGLAVRVPGLQLGMPGRALGVPERVQ